MRDERDLTPSISTSLSKKSLLEDFGTGSDSKATTPRSYERLVVQGLVAPEAAVPLKVTTL